ncbi:MAG: phosphoglycerate dehydrogenase [Acidimicrobiia bacterium]|nr:phosphoglycerate dehydrogenase [Acidimicrobiia bacterium]MYC58413.1 phosphoglycerate dehydrogenase [Acidimicrobiia bacterium]MYG94172.1 phosphoglycerate dehydrogenase [Acidimicrobiia bacterium]MYI30481.1 phosphoglycerate dehydrogenase [Acidimicrobiia bacterium]
MNSVVSDSTSSCRVLVAEKIADIGLAKLRHAGHQVDVRTGMSSDELLEAVQGANALIVRSATQVTAEVIQAGKDLVIVGRAGVGLDNVDVAVATQHGVLVVNDTLSNITSAAEHTMALMLAQARNIPQAHSALVQGRWERSRWEGIELCDKTLGIIGLGRIGRLVAERALGFAMRVIASDPYVSEEIARRSVMSLMSVEELVAQSDFITIHVARTPDTIGLINSELLRLAKPNLRIINVSRGGIVHEADLAEAVVSGRIAGAALDVFDGEPITESPLFGLDSVVVTPHLGASTSEAQSKAGDAIAEQVLLGLAGEFVPAAVNVPAKEVPDALRPYLPLGEQLGRLFGTLCDRLPEVLDVELCGEIGKFDNAVVVMSVVRGLLSAVSDMHVSYVNALDMAKERGMEVRGNSTPTVKDHVNLLTVRGGDHSLGGRLDGVHKEPVLVSADGHTLHMSPAQHMIFLSNEDRPGIIGLVGTLLGDAGINIQDMNVGRSSTGEGASMVIATAQPLPKQVAVELEAIDGVKAARYMGLAVAPA